MVPNTEEVLAKLSGAKIFSSLNACSGFWQISLQHESSLLIAFTTSFSIFCFKHLPFSPTLHQRFPTMVQEGDTALNVSLQEHTTHPETDKLSGL